MSMAAVYMDKGMETAYRFMIDTLHLYEHAYFLTFAVMLPECTLDAILITFAAILQRLT